MIVATIRIDSILPVSGMMQVAIESIAEGVRLGAEVEAENMGIDLGILVGEDEVEGPARRAVGGGPTADDGINSRFVYIRSTLFTILLFSVSIGDATSTLSLRTCILGSVRFDVNKSSMNSVPNVCLC